MKAWINRKNRARLEAVEIADPSPQGTQVVVDVTHCGVCHSDLHTWQGETDYGRRGIVKKPEPLEPVAMGHEIAGVVSAMGPDASGISLGDAVIVYPWLGCGRCADCENGRDNLCAVETRSIGFRQHGGFADKIVVPDSRYLISTGKVEPALAATYACSGLTVRSAIRKIMPIAPGEPIVVIGAGGLGFQAIAVLKALTSNPIISLDRSPEKGRLALAEGASSFLPISGDAQATAVVDAAGGKVLAVVDFVNNGETSTLAFDILRKGGRMVQVGLYGGELAVPLHTLAISGISILGSITGTIEDLRDVVELAECGLLKAVPITTMPRYEVNQALEHLERGQVSGRIVLAN